MSTLDHLCGCGCGQRAPIASKTNRARGVTKGQPLRFIHGHNNRRPPEARFWPRVNKTDGCWLWTGATVHGYGSFCVKNKTVVAHRFAYEQLVGPIPAGLVLDHLCRTEACVNPAHLEPVTIRENTLRGIRYRNEVAA